MKVSTNIYFVSIRLHMEGGGMLRALECLGMGVGGGDVLVHRHICGICAVVVSSCCGSHLLW